MRFCRLFCVAAVAAVLGFAPAPLPKKERLVKRDDMEVLQGVWKMTYQDSGGTPTDHNYRVLVKGNHWAFITGNQPIRGDEFSYWLTLDQTVTPRALEWAYDRNRTGGWVASYRIEGKKLTVIYVSGTLKNDLHRRPTNFSGPAPFKMVFEYVGKL
jgi:uncharacterized protein (TIGR03067 family)